MKAARSRAAIRLAAGLALMTACAPALAAGSPDDQGDALGTVISRAIHEGGPFFTATERAVISAKCGYAPGEWDGFDANIQNGVFHCENGKTVDDAEMRARLEVAQPRITARVNAAMARPEVRAAISAVARKAARDAIANLRIDRDD